MIKFIKYYNKTKVKKLIRKALRELEYPETYYEPVASDKYNEKLFRKMIKEWFDENL